MPILEGVVKPSEAPTAAAAEVVAAGAVLLLVWVPVDDVLAEEDVEVFTAVLALPTHVALNRTH